MTGLASSTSSERIVLGGMLLVAMPVTARLFPSLALAVLPTTLLAVAGFWLWSRRVSASGLVPCSIFGGGFVGYLNSGLALQVCMVLHGDFDGGWLFSLIAGFPGIVYGVIYGFAFLPLLAIARRLRKLHGPEAFDRTLVVTGLWGLVVLAGAAPVASRLALEERFGPPLAVPFPNALWVVATISLLTMLVGGVERL